MSVSKSEVQALVDDLAGLIGDVLARLEGLKKPLWLEPRLAESPDVRSGVIQSVLHLHGLLHVSPEKVYESLSHALLAIDQEVGGLARYLRIEEMKVLPEFAKAFNHVAAKQNPSPAPIMPELVNGPQPAPEQPPVEPVTESPKPKSKK